MVFQFEATAGGRRLKFLNVIEEHSLLCLAIRVRRCCKVKDVVAVLEDLTSLYPSPAFIDSENGPDHRPCPQTLERGQRHQHFLYRVKITVAERPCRIVQQPVQRRVPQY